MLYIYIYLFFTFTTSLSGRAVCLYSFASPFVAMFPFYLRRWWGLAGPSWFPFFFHTRASTYTVYTFDATCTTRSVFGTVCIYRASIPCFVAEYMIYVRKYIIYHSRSSRDGKKKREKLKVNKKKIKGARCKSLHTLCVQRQWSDVIQYIHTYIYTCA